MASFNGLDIFGVPLEYATYNARQKHFPKELYNISLVLSKDVQPTRLCKMYEIYSAVYNGYLSLQSATYLLLGEYTPEQDNYLRGFLDFCVNYPSLSSTQIHLLWQGKKQSPPANMFVLPLAVRDFSEETEQYRKDLEHYKLMLFTDLPPDDYGTM